MFVRKGTIRKNRGGSNRRSIRRPTGNNGSRKSHILDDPSSTGSGSYRLSTNDDISSRLTPTSDACATTSSSTNSFRFDEVARSRSKSPNGVYKSKDEDIIPSPVVHTVRYQSELPTKPSPARSGTNTVVVSHFISLLSRKIFIYTFITWHCLLSMYYTYL